MLSILEFSKQLLETNDTLSMQRRLSCIYLSIKRLKIFLSYIGVSFPLSFARLLRLLFPFDRQIGHAYMLFPLTNGMDSSFVSTQIYLHMLLVLDA
mgnify:CR=1 FL=1